MKYSLVTIVALFLFGNCYCQNSTMAKAFYKKALIAYESQEYFTALQHIESTKMELGGNTNPDIVYIEAKTRLQNDVNVNKAKELFNQFLNEADEHDSRKDEVALILVDIHSSDAYYENGNIAVRKSSDGNTVSTLIYDENGKRICKLKSLDVNDFEVVRNTKVANPLYKTSHTYSAKYIFTIYSMDESNEVLQEQYYESMSAYHNHQIHSIRIGGYRTLFEGFRYSRAADGVNSYGQYTVSHPELDNTEYHELPLSERVQSTLSKECGISRVFFYSQWETGRWNKELKAKEKYNFSEDRLFTKTTLGYRKVKGFSIYNWDTKSWVDRELTEKTKHEVNIQRNGSNDVSGHNSVTNNSPGSEEVQAKNELEIVVVGELRHVMEKRQLEEDIEHYKNDMNVIDKIRVYEKNNSESKSQNDYTSIGFADNWTIQNSELKHELKDRQLSVQPASTDRLKDVTPSLFAVFQDKDFNPLADFTMSFEYGMNVQYYIRNKERIPLYIGLFDSYSVQSSIFENLSTASIVFEQLTSEKVVFADNKNIIYHEEYNRIRNANRGHSTYAGKYSDKSPETDFGLQTELTIKGTPTKKPKSVRDFRAKLRKRLSNDLIGNRLQSDLIYSTITIIKRGNTIVVKDSMKYAELELTLESEPMEFKYFKSDQISLRIFPQKSSARGGLVLTDFKLSQ